jgi:hypothetical protein
MIAASWYLFDFWKAFLYFLILVACFRPWMRPNIARVHLALFVGVILAGYGVPLGFWIDGDDEFMRYPRLWMLVPLVWSFATAIAIFIALINVTIVRNVRLAPFAAPVVAVLLGPVIVATFLASAWHHLILDRYKASALSVAAGRDFCVLPAPVTSSNGFQTSIISMLKNANYPNIDGIYGFYSTLRTGGQLYNWSFRQSAFVLSSNYWAQATKFAQCTPDRRAFSP